MGKFFHALPFKCLFCSLALRMLISRRGQVALCCKSAAGKPRAEALP